MYQCLNSSKCISIYRLMDRIFDCPRNDDEDVTKINHTHIMKQIEQVHFKCHVANKYISQSLVENSICDCGLIESGWCEDENLDMNYIRRNISFQTICDGFTELLPYLINGQNHTDETECEQWLCNNTYTHCDGIWNCFNGEDEIGCLSSSLLHCSFDKHICLSSYTNQIICLPMEKINDGNIDCVGAMDERNLCHNHSQIDRMDNFYCITNIWTSCLQVYHLCNNVLDCIHGDDEKFCSQNKTHSGGYSICFSLNRLIRSDKEELMCETMKLVKKNRIIHFLLDRRQNLTIGQINNINFSSILSIDKSKQQPFRCHRGFDIRLWLNNKNNFTTTCFCPPSFYGDQCQYQNQRVSLSIQFRASSNSWEIPFAIIVSLADNYGNIHSYEQFSYLSVRDCKIKFSIYLLYSTKPKDPTKFYSIRIDIYEKFSLAYRGSLLLPILFSFLPIHRLAFIVDIPPDNSSIEYCSNDQCNHHGKCMKYLNNLQNNTFCQCYKGWSGRFCSIPYHCSCSSDSLCMGVSHHNRSICVCPLLQFGPRCLISDTICSINDNSTCKNGGLCIPNDEYIESDQKFTCICPKGFIGKQCEIIENKIIFSFVKDIILTQSIFIHFIQVMNNDRPRRATTFRTIPFKQDSIIIHWPQPFHLVFIELLNKNYYLTIVQKNYIQSLTINQSIKSSDRCQHISEIFNDTIVKLDLIRRIKYYQLPCGMYSSNLSCFYDDIHLCICQQHVANCFEFNHNQTFDCLGQSVCEHNGQCFQDTSNCPQRSMCICLSCFYGTRCQFSTSGLSISLDAILGYHIQPNIKITQQPAIIQISAVLVMIFIIIGCINGTSFTTIITMIMFGSKFWILLSAQMEMIVNRSFLLFQCYSIDFLLRVGLNMNLWLNACVAIERTVTTIKGPKFSKKKSVKVAKSIIIILLISIIATNIHDPIHRRLIDEENDNEKRIWCIVSYSSSLQTYNSSMNIFHFIGSFLCNLISAIILIRKKSSHKIHVQPIQNFQQVLRKQVRQHKNLFIAPIVLAILALPHLIISFTSKCMKSPDSSWLFLSGYFISFIPLMLTFVIFILPSKFYKDELRKILKRYQSHLHLSFFSRHSNCK